MESFGLKQEQQMSYLLFLELHVVNFICRCFLFFPTLALYCKPITVIHRRRTQ